MKCETNHNEKKVYSAKLYKRYIKRLLDIVLSIIGLLCLLPFLIVLCIIGTIAMKGNPFFVQIRPGKDENLFALIKFRTMSNEKDKQGNLLPDEKRLNRYGRFLRSTSLDELPELLNILNGTLSLVGPRPQLVYDLVFMSDEQRKRHTVRPGLTGLAQINGRNNITWMRKLDYDLKYLDNISFSQDAAIVLKTIVNVIKRKDVVRDGTESDIDFGDWLLMCGEVSRIEYEQKQKEAKIILSMYNNQHRKCINK